MGSDNKPSIGCEVFPHILAMVLTRMHFGTLSSDSSPVNPGLCYQSMTVQFSQQIFQQFSQQSSQTSSNHHDALQVSLPGKRRLIPRFKRTALGSSSLGVIVESGRLIFCTFGLKGCFTSFFDLNLEKSCPASILGGA